MEEEAVASWSMVRDQYRTLRIKDKDMVEVQGCIMMVKTGSRLVYQDSFYWKFLLE